MLPSELTKIWEIESSVNRCLQSKSMLMCKVISLPEVSQVLYQVYTRPRNFHSNQLHCSRENLAVMHRTMIHCAAVTKNCFDVAIHKGLGTLWE